jgi:hypothetical protein
VPLQLHGGQLGGQPNFAETFMVLEHDKQTVFLCCRASLKLYKLKKSHFYLFFTNQQRVKTNACKENVQVIRHMFNYRDLQEEHHFLLTLLKLGMCWNFVPSLLESRAGEATTTTNKLM